MCSWCRSTAAISISRASCSARSWRSTTRRWILIGGIATASLLALAVIYRPLVVEYFDCVFLRAVNGRGGLVHGLFLALVVFNMVAGFQALGTLMAVGLMIAACRRRALLGARVCGR